MEYGSSGIEVFRFVRDGRLAYEQFEWGVRDIQITSDRDVVLFDRSGCEFPSTWSRLACGVVAHRYFRHGSVEESSLRQLVDRVVDTIVRWGIADGYFSDGDAEPFREELKYLIVSQRASFNSPVWFNIGVPGVRQQACSCFIVSIQDDLEGVFDWYRTEGRLFAGGAGTGTNLSNIRSRRELLDSGGPASGPLGVMRGADASAGSIKSTGLGRAAKMCILDALYPDISEFVWAKAREERKARTLRDAGFDMGLDGADMISVQYQHANNSVRITDQFMHAVLIDADWDLIGVADGNSLQTIKARDLWQDIAHAAGECGDPGLHFDTTAMDILIGNSDQPTEPIKARTRRLRPLGLGYANLGAVLMALGHPYDSAGGRLWAAALTSLHSAQAYLTSTELARHLNPFDDYQENRLDVLSILGKHRSAAAEIARSGDDEVQSALAACALSVWDRALDQAEQHGVGNSQATSIAPTGTIGFMLDCDTTGIEPELSLQKTQRFANGTSETTFARVVPRTLSRLGYTSSAITGILAHLHAAGTIVGAPGLHATDLSVFACSIGDNVISAEGHVRMVAAVQPFISGAISKTINMTDRATVGDIAGIHLLSWQLGLKAVTIYRNNSKVSQPLSASPRPPEVGILR